MTDFDRGEVLAQVQKRLWRYLSAAAAVEGPSEAVTGLLQLRPGSLQRLGAAHVAAGDRAAVMLAAVPRALRELPSSVVRRRVETRGALRPPVDWPSTALAQRLTGDRSRYVSSPAERAYDTAAGRLVALALRRMVHLVDEADLGAGVFGDALSARRGRALRLLSHQKLHGVTPVRTLPDRSLESLRHRRSFSAVVDFVRTSAGVLDELDAALIEAVVKQRLLAPAPHDKLFELAIGFHMVDTLVHDGWHEAPPELLPYGALPFADLRSGERRIQIWWQRSVWSVLGLNSAPGSFRRVLADAGMSASTLRPDFVLHEPATGNILLIEVKLSTTGNTTVERDGIRDVLAYLDDASSLLIHRAEPHALVVAWDATGTPGAGRVLVTAQDGAGAAALAAIARWEQSAATALLNA